MASGTSPASPPHADEPDPSMDDILASIRRILNDDENAPKQASGGVLMLDPSMIVEEGETPAATHDEGRPIDRGHAPGSGETLETDSGRQSGVEEPTALAIADDDSKTSASVRPDLAFPPPSVSRDAPPPDSPLVAPAAAAAAAHSVGSLVRTLAAERSAAVTRGGLTIEDLVREEVRPVLKEWLDTHLPPLVERMVRAELERVVGRAV